MKKQTLGALAAVAAVAVGSVATGVAVHAASDAPWQAAAIKSPDSVGTITLVDTSGNPVTSGPIDQPLAAYAVVSTGAGALLAGDTAAHTSATLSVYTPTSVASAPVTPSSVTDRTAGPDSWTGYQVTAPTVQSAVPGTITGGPAVALAGSVTLKQFIAGYRNTLSDSAYQGVYELRLRTGAAGRAVSAKYAVLDLQVSGDTWHLYGEGATSAAPTQTTLAAAPAVVKAGQPVTLTATVSPSAAGTVQFKAGATAIGAPVAVNTTTGKAATTWTPSAAGSFSLTASFTPADASAFGASTSVPTTYAVAAPAAVTPTWPAFRYGTASIVHVSVAPAAGGTASIVYAGRVIASAPVSAGKADVRVPATALPAGARSLFARFTSASPATVASADSAPRTVTVAKAAAKVANTTVPTRVKSVKRTTFVFTVTAPGGAVTGTVKVYDGSRVVATTTLRSGRATVSLRLKKGKHKIKARFLGSANVAAASGAVVTVTAK